jgi:hypothetical protein
MPREAIRLSKEQFAYNIILNLLKENNIGEDELPDKP